MSRPPLSSTSSSSTTPTLVPSSTTPSPYTPRNNSPLRPTFLRVNTDTSSLPFQTSHNTPSPSTHQFNRNRSASTLPPFSPAAAAGADPPSSASWSTHHHISRSLSHAPLSSSSVDSPTRARFDIAAAVSGLRGGEVALPPRPARDARRSPYGEAGEADSTDKGGASASSSNERSEALTIKRIGEALERSGDEGDTLDLSRRGIEGIGVEAVELFRKGVGKDKRGVWRLALSYNSLRDQSLDSSFAQLSRLRYLNLKGNAFTEFPPPLCQMTSLEILDLSKNKISQFPDVPGRLAQLKVLSLSSNRVLALPAYLVDFGVLKVFKLDGNPIEWPPKEVLGALVDPEALASKSTGDAGSLASSRSRRDDDMRPWIENMKSWMRQRASETDRLLARSRNDEDAYLASEEEPMSAVSAGATGATPWASLSSSSLVAASSQRTIRPIGEDAGRPASPARPPVLAQRSRSSTLFSDPPDHTESPDELLPPRRPFALSSHARTDSQSSTFSAQPISASTGSMSAHSRNASGSLPQPAPPAPASSNSGHSRGASFATAQRLSGTLTAKQSLPDLRQSHARIIQERRNDGQSRPPLGLGINTPTSARFQIGPASPWGAGGSDTRSPTKMSLGPIGGAASRPLARKRSADTLQRRGSVVGLRGDILADLADRHNSQEAPQVDESRNSYFRRLSTLPVSTISKAIPDALLRFIDAIRGILFALSQLHSALRQYLVFAVDDRAAGVFSRVMEPAGNYMNSLINALDRFDSMSRRGAPALGAIRGVVDAAKESVAVFAKVMAVLRMQMPALRSNDVRYTRTLLLMVYGSMAEVACSWQAMGPLFAEIRPLLSTDGTALVAARAMGGVMMMAQGSASGRTPISPIPERAESSSPPSTTRPSVSTAAGSPLVSQLESVAVTPQPSQSRPAGAGVGRTRRQGGSFSAEDVEKGMLMGSPGPSGAFPDDAKPLGYVRHRPSASAQSVLEEQEEESEEGEEELAALPPFPLKTRPNEGGSTSSIPITPPEMSQTPQPFTVAGRQGHHPSSSSGSNLSSGLAAPLRKLSVDIRPPTPASATLFDEDLLDVIETATDIAFTVWLRLAEDIGVPTPPVGHSKNPSTSSFASSVDSSTRPSYSRRPSTISTKHYTDLVQLLSSSEQNTAALRESTMGLRANPHSYAMTTLPDDAQTFIKSVVRVSELVKAISASHAFSQGVRQSLSKLTQATRECAILIQVSSLRPGAATPASIPPASALGHWSRGSQGGGSSVEDLNVGVGDGRGGAYYQPPPLSAGGVMGNGGSHGNGNGLRGLQLPSRQMALGRTRSANAVSPGPASASVEGRGGMGRMGEPPRSAQPSQTAF